MVFSCDAADVDNILIAGDIISLNGIEKTKNELSVEILRHLTSFTPTNPEVESRLLARLLRAIS